MTPVHFRAALGGYGGSGQQMLNNATYTKVGFRTVCGVDTSGRYVAASGHWVPVHEGEEPRVVLVGTQVFIMGGASHYANPLFNCKVLKNDDHDNALLPASGQFHPNPYLDGMVNNVVGAIPVWCEPGDTVSVHANAYAAYYAQPFYSYGGYGTTMVDPNLAHTWFWGLDWRLDTALAAVLADLEARVAALEA